MKIVPNIIIAIDYNQVLQINFQKRLHDYLNGIQSDCYFITLISTRRFCSRPSGVVFGAIGCSNP